jgi:hypothetical protein
MILIQHSQYLEDKQLYDSLVLTPLLDYNKLKLCSTLCSSEYDSDHVGILVNDFRVTSLLFNILDQLQLTKDTEGEIWWTLGKFQAYRSHRYLSVSVKDGILEKMISRLYSTDVCDDVSAEMYLISMRLVGNNSHLDDLDAPSQMYEKRLKTSDKRIFRVLLHGINKVDEKSNENFHVDISYKMLINLKLL